MCIVLFWFGNGQDEPPSDAYRLILASNRDEYLHRSAARAVRWPEQPEIVGGRDLVAGGTWLGLAGKRWATVTNIREPDMAPGRISRGLLASSFLESTVSARAFVEGIDLCAYGGFNVVVGDGIEVWHATNRFDRACRRLEPGWHCVTNGDVREVWPKARHGLHRFRETVEGATSRTPGDLATALFEEVLADETPVAPAHTGYSDDLERRLARLRVPAAPLFDGRKGEWGTRTSTVVLLYRDGRFVYRERDLDPTSRTWSEIDVGTSTT